MRAERVVLDEVALMGAADCIVTGDQDLLELVSFHGLPILTPASFLERPPDAGLMADMD